MIAIPKAEQFRDEELVRLVDEVNHSEVDPLIQLDPAVYVYRLADNSISVVQTMAKEVQA